MQSEETGMHAFFTALGVCLFLLGSAFFILKVYPIPPEYYDEAFTIVAIAAIALISVIVYQSQSISASAQSLAQVMSEDILIYSHELFSELYRSSPVPYMVIDTKGKIESANVAAVRFFDVDINSLNGFDVFSCIEEEGKQTISIQEYYVQGKALHNIEVKVNRPDGIVLWAVLSLFAFKGKKNAKQGLLTLVDITKLKEIDIAKTEFVSLASHQLRTPISGMKWNVELLLTTEKDALQPKQRGYIERVARSLEQMNALVDDFLSASKFELGTLKPVYETILSETFFGGVLDEQREMAERKSVTINADIGSFEMRTDTHLLRMITSNILGNAVKYTPELGTVSYNVSANRDSFSITIGDTGIGIPLQDQSTIFTKMFRATNARNHASGGTGLGLYIAKEAAEVLGGTISFESVEGKGTTFTIVLPLV